MKDKHILDIKTRLIKISLPLSYQLCFTSQKNGHIPHNKFQDCTVESAAWRWLCSVIKGCRIIPHHYQHAYITSPPVISNFSLSRPLRRGTINPCLTKWGNLVMRNRLDTAVWKTSRRKQSCSLEGRHTSLVGWSLAIAGWSFTLYQTHFHNGDELTAQKGLNLKHNFHRSDRAVGLLKRCWAPTLPILPTHTVQRTPSPQKTHLSSPVCKRTTSRLWAAVSPNTRAPKVKMTLLLVKIFLHNNIHRKIKPKPKLSFHFCFGVNSSNNVKGLSFVNTLFAAKPEVTPQFCPS